MSLDEDAAEFTILQWVGRPILGFYVENRELDSRPQQEIAVPPEADVLVVPKRFTNRDAWLGRRPGSATVSVGRVGTIDHACNRIPVDHRQAQVCYYSPGLRHYRTADGLQVRYRNHPVT